MERFLLPGAVIVALSFLALALYFVLPVGYDFYHWYRPVPLAWVAGETRLYDEASRRFFSPPWTV